MNLKDLFDVDIRIPLDIYGQKVFCYFRKSSMDEELEFRRRQSMSRLKDNGTLESTPTQLKANVWLFDKLLTKVTIKNGTGQEEEQPEEDRKYITDDAKIVAINSLKGQIRKGEDEVLRD